jgi:hypothetical protein
MRSHTTLKAGDWVEVLGQEEILRTLDGLARLEGMPFMPEMLRFCGKRFQVYKRAHRTCDTVDYVGGRHLDGTVHLDGLRCDGEGHGGCHALCLLFWKEAWLRKVPGPDGAGSVAGPAAAPAPGTAPDVFRIGTRKPGEAPDAADPTYVCQATQLLEATVALRRSDLGPYLEDLSSGNVRLGELVVAAAFVGYTHLAGGRYGLGTPLRWLYDAVARLRGRWPLPDPRGMIPRGGKTPSRKLDLQPGELVRVRSLEEIEETIDGNLRNRGMGYHSEMVQFCGRTFRVARRIEKIVHEKTGKMIPMKNDVIILEDAVCKGRYINNCRRFCPRSVYLYFREIWLERAEAP